MRCARSSQRSWCDVRWTLAVLVPGLMIGGGERAAAAPVPVQSVLIRLIDEAEVPARELGVLASISAAEGQLVREGAELARLDDRQAQLLQQKAQAELDVARKEAESDVEVRVAAEAATFAAAELNRAKEAKQRLAQSISQSELDKLHFEVQRTSLEQDEARQKQEIAKLKELVKQREWEIAVEHVQRHTIVAPLTGMVAKRYRHRGEWVQPGDKVFRIVRLDRLRAEGFVDAASVRSTLAGRPATLTIDLPGQPQTRFSGTVTFVDPEIDPVNRQVRVWVEVDNPRLQLQPGMRAEMSIDVDAPARSKP